VSDLIVHLPVISTHVKPLFSKLKKSLETSILTVKSFETILQHMYQSIMGISNTEHLSFDDTICHYFPAIILLKPKEFSTEVTALSFTFVT